MKKYCIASLLALFGFSPFVFFALFADFNAENVLLCICLCSLCSLPLIDYLGENENDLFDL